MSHEIRVGMGEYKICRKPNHILITSGLGECAGIVIYNTEKKIYGLAHCIVPYGNRVGTCIKPTIETMIYRLGSKNLQAVAAGCGDIFTNTGMRNAKIINEIIGDILIHTEFGGTNMQEIMVYTNSSNIIINNITV